MVTENVIAHISESESYPKDVKEKLPSVNTLPLPGTSYGRRSVGPSVRNLKVSARKSPRPKALWYQIANPNPTAKPKKRLKQVSARRGRENKLYSSLRREFLSDNPVCVVCAKAKATEIHHKYGRAGSLLCDVRGWMSVCGDCHRFITDHPAQARALGFTCEVGHWNTPFKT